MYGLSLMGELNELRKQYHNNKFKVFYFSKGLNNIQMFIEFLFEILHEKDEPLICMVELVKAALKLREYYQLIHRERVNSYLELDSYRELTLLKEIKENHIKMMRTKKRIERIKGFQVDNSLHALKYDSGV